MEKKRAIVIAAEMLRSSYHFAGNRDENDPCAFAYKIGDDGTDIEVFSATIAADTFYFPEVVTTICSALGLSVYATLGHPYGHNIREQIVFRIH